MQPHEHVSLVLNLFGMQFLRAGLTTNNCLHTLVLAAQYDCHSLFDNAVSVFFFRTWSLIFIHDRYELQNSL